MHYWCTILERRNVTTAMTRPARKSDWPKSAWPNSDWKAGFLFVANRPILDFLNTAPVQDGERTELLPDFHALLRWFEAAGLVSSRDAAKLRRRWGNSASARQVVSAMRELRERLRNQVLRWERGGSLQPAALAELNGLMAEYPMRTRLKLKASAGAATRESWFSPRRPEDLFAPLASSAADLFATADRNRLRKCGNCILHFYDTSKKGTRRWCSMQLCGNRLKVAAYAARQRAGG
jgi:predicted RNA-binding Zn ribbon-like protein